MFTDHSLLCEQVVEVKINSKTIYTCIQNLKKFLDFLIHYHNLISHKKIDLIKFQVSHKFKYFQLISY